MPLMNLPRWIALLLLAAALSPVRAGDDIGLVAVSDFWRFMGFRPDATPPENWREESFDDGDWYSGQSGFGYSTYGETTRLPATNGWERVLLRTKFTAPAGAHIKWLSFRADYGGGFILWLNGTEVARRGFSGLPGADQPLSTSAAPRYPGAGELIYLGTADGLLLAGTNTLAVQLHSDGVYSQWPLFTAELLGNFSRAPYLQNVSSNRAELLFQTPVPLSARVEFGTGSTGERLVLTPAGTNHIAVLTNLLPGTRYAYKVTATEGTNSGNALPVSFRTLPTSGPLTVQVIGDSGGADIWQHAVTDRMVEDGADLLLHAGDIIYPSFSYGLADIRFLSVQRALMRTTPSFFAWGNHDLIQGTAPFLSALRSPVNDTPMNDHFAQGTIPESYYSFDAGDVHFVVLFQPFVTQYLMRTNSPQAAWLDADLAATRKPWKVLIAHHPWETSGAHRFDDWNFNGKRDATEYAEAVMPIAQRYGVQLILAGHDHNYERLIPVGGVNSIITGGGGGPPYGLLETDEKSAVFHVVYHYTRLTFDGDTMKGQCINWRGDVLDEFYVQRVPPPVRVHDAIPGTPRIEDAPSNDGDGNIAGQTFDFMDAPAIPSFSGLDANLGNLRVKLDGTNLYLGFERLTISPRSDAYVFVEVPGVAGVASLAGLGNGISDPNGEGVDALDVAENLGFTNFRPSIAAVFGDEYADGSIRNFRRPLATNALGQGVFRLTPDFATVPGARLQQFNRSPQVGLASFNDSDADFVEIAIPVSQLGGLAFGQEIKVGAVVGLNYLPGLQTRPFDNGYLGDIGRLSSDGTFLLSGLTVRLPAEPDWDHDGLDAEAEAAAGTDPRKPDTDGDGLPDGWEVANRLNPLSGTAEHGFDGDIDNDGYSNGEEFGLGTDPQNPNQPIRLHVGSGHDGSLRLGWRSGRGRRYSIEASEALAGPYQPLPGFPETASTNRGETLLTPGNTPRFFKLRMHD